MAEANGVTELLKDVNSRIKVQYIPKTPGNHGAKVLWSVAPDNQGVLDCPDEFLK